MSSRARRFLLRVLRSRRTSVCAPSAARWPGGHFRSLGGHFRCLGGSFGFSGAAVPGRGKDFRFGFGAGGGFRVFHDDFRSRGGGDFRSRGGDDFRSRGDDFRSRGGGSRDDPEDCEDAEAEVLESGEPLFPASAQRVVLVHPDVRGRGPKSARVTDGHVSEAEALVRALPGWSVVKTLVVPAGNPVGGRGFGRGRFRELTETIRACADVTSVFLNVERMTPETQKTLEAAWRVDVFDRFTLVLHVFRVHARTKEAKLQLALAEIPLLRSTLRSGPEGQEQQGHDSRNMLGSGESYTQRRRRLLRDREAKIRHMLERVQAQRALVRRERERQGLPVISVVGYTNAGKTALIRALTSDPALRPRDQPFATLDVTAHAGSLPSHTRVLYVDTVGFLSQLPVALIQAFTATLGDVAQSDVIMHVRDVSHPHTEEQRATVEAALRVLRLPPTRLASVVHVHNKVDLVPGYTPAEPGAVAVSALLGHGIEDLRSRLDEHVSRVTGRRVLSMCLALGGPQLRWLYREATVQRVDDLPQTGCARVTVAMGHAAYGRFRKLFPEVACMQEVTSSSPAPSGAD